MSDISNCTSQSLIMVFGTARVFLSYVYVDVNYMFVYVILLYEHWCHSRCHQYIYSCMLICISVIRMKVVSIRIDTQVTHLATAHMECAAWVRIPIPTSGQSQVGYITVTDSK